MRLSALVGQKSDQMAACGFVPAAVETFVEQAFVEQVAEFLLPAGFELVVANTAFVERIQAFVEAEAENRPY